AERLSYLAKEYKNRGIYFRNNGADLIVTKQLDGADAGELEDRIREASRPLKAIIIRESEDGKFERITIRNPDHVLKKQLVISAEFEKSANERWRDLAAAVAKGGFKFQDQGGWFGKPIIYTISLTSSKIHKLLDILYALVDLTEINIQFKP